KIVLVETPISGFARISQQAGGAGNLSIRSPRPFANAVVLYTQNGTSEPIIAPKAASSSTGIFKDHNRFRPRNTAAASLLPPPKPAVTGIFFSILICTPSVMLYLLLRALAALNAKFRSSFGTYLLSYEAIMLSGFKGYNSIRSDKSMVVIIISTS